MTTAIPLWSKAETAQWHRIRDTQFGRKQFRCGLPFTRLSEGPTDMPTVHAYAGLCPQCEVAR